MRRGNNLRHALVIAALLVGLFCNAAAAQVRSTIIGPGETQYPVAVSSLKVSGAPAVRGEQFADVLVRDLQLSGLFRVIPRQTYIESAQTSGVEEHTIQFANWSVLGAHALVNGTLTVTGDQVVVEARLFDVARRSQLCGRRYRGTLEDLPRIADRFADEILATVTGERGPFDSRIAFLSTRDGRFKELYVMRANGTELTRLTQSSTLNLAPSWGPRGDLITLTSYRDGDPNLYSLSYPGGQWSALSSLPGLNLGGGFSPDGESLVTTIEFDGNSEIGILKPDGSIQYRVTDHWAIDVSPAWSPDGRSIAFCSDRSGSPQIYVMGRDGRNVRRVSRNGKYSTSPAWSPDGKRIAYASRSRGGFQVFVVNRDGSGVHQVTTEGSNEDPVWSPDGRYLLFSSTRRGRTHLYLSDVAGIHQVQLTQGKGSDTSPSWSTWVD